MTVLAPPLYLAQLTGVRLITWDGRGPVTWHLVSGATITQRLPLKERGQLAEGDFGVFAARAWL